MPVEMAGKAMVEAPRESATWRGSGGRAAGGGGRLSGGGRIGRAGGGAEGVGAVWEFVWQAARRGERSSVGEKTGPTVWMTQWAGRLPAVVATAPPGRRPRP